MITVTHAQPEHRDAFLRMCRDVYAEGRVSQWGELDIEAMGQLFDQSIQCNLLNGNLGAGDVRVFIALDDDRPIGALAVTIQPVYFAPTTLMAQEMFVWCDHEHRKNGVAGMLFAAACEWAKAGGCRGIAAGALMTAAARAVGKIVSALGFEPIENVWVRAF
jgi:GNAT superfamily N-acetyltransferase